MYKNVKVIWALGMIEINDHVQKVFDKALKEYNNPIQQYRAVWVSHFAGDISAYQDAESYKKDLTTIMDNMETWGMNAMVFHIRTHNNAMYDSKLNPRARWWANVDFDEFDFFFTNLQNLRCAFFSVPGKVVYDFCKVAFRILEGVVADGDLNGYVFVAAFAVYLIISKYRASGVCYAVRFLIVNTLHFLLLSLDFYIFLLYNFLTLIIKRCFYDYRPKENNSCI